MVIIRWTKDVSGYNGRELLISLVWWEAYRHWIFPLIHELLHHILWNLTYRNELFCQKLNQLWDRLWVKFWLSTSRYDGEWKKARNKQKKLS